MLERISTNEVGLKELKRPWGRVNFFGSDHLKVNDPKLTKETTILGLEGTHSVGEVVGEDLFSETGSARIYFFENTYNNKQYKEIANSPNVRYFTNIDISVGPKLNEIMSGEFFAQTLRNALSFASVLMAGVGSVLDSKVGRRTLLGLAGGLLVGTAPYQVDNLLSKYSIGIKSPIDSTDRIARYGIFFRNLVASVKADFLGEYLHKEKGEENVLSIVYGAKHGRILNLMRDLSVEQRLKVIEEILKELKKKMSSGEYEMLERSIYRIPVQELHPHGQNTYIYDIRTKSKIE
jgi:hypothetical protein